LLNDRTALILAALQAIAAAAVTVAVFALSGWVSHPGQESRLLLAVVITYLPSTLISTFIGVALCAAVAGAMDGRHLSLAQALSVPLRRLGQILLWSLLAADVGLPLEQLAAACRSARGSSPG
jgi:ABC-type multidrug transport system permease subunit